MSVVAVRAAASLAGAAAAGADESAGAGCSAAGAAAVLPDWLSLAAEAGGVASWAVVRARPGDGPSDKIAGTASSAMPRTGSNPGRSQQARVEPNARMRGPLAKDAAPPARHPAGQSAGRRQGVNRPARRTKVRASRQGLIVSRTPRPPPTRLPAFFAAPIGPYRPLAVRSLLPLTVRTVEEEAAARAAQLAAAIQHLGAAARADPMRLFLFSQRQKPGRRRRGRPLWILIARLRCQNGPTLPRAARLGQAPSARLPELGDMMGAEICRFSAAPPFGGSLLGGMGSSGGKSRRSA